MKMCSALKGSWLGAGGRHERRIQGAVAATTERSPPAPRRKPTSKSEGGGLNTDRPFRKSLSLYAIYKTTFFNGFGGNRALRGGSLYGRLRATVHYRRSDLAALPGAALRLRSAGDYRVRIH